MLGVLLISCSSTSNGAFFACLLVGIQAALASQQRSTGYVLHYVKDLQLFAAAEVATAGASGGFTRENEEDVLPPGASDDLMGRLYRPSNGASATSQQQTSTNSDFSLFINPIPFPVPYAWR